MDYLFNLKLSFYKWEQHLKNGYKKSMYCSLIFSQHTETVVRRQARGHPGEGQVTGRCFRRAGNVFFFDSGLGYKCFVSFGKKLF